MLTCNVSWPSSAGSWRSPRSQPSFQRLRNLNTKMKKIWWIFWSCLCGFYNPTFSCQYIISYPKLMDSFQFSQGSWQEFDLKSNYNKSELKSIFKSIKMVGHKYHCLIYLLSNCVSFEWMTFDRVHHFVKKLWLILTMFF